MARGEKTERMCGFVDGRGDGKESKKVWRLGETHFRDRKVAPSSHFPANDKDLGSEYTSVPYLATTACTLYLC